MLILHAALKELPGSWRIRLPHVIHAVLTNTLPAHLVIDALIVWWEKTFVVDLKRIQ